MRRTLGLRTLPQVLSGQWTGYGWESADSPGLTCSGNMSAYGSSKMRHRALKERKDNMDVESVVAQLRHEIGRIELAIAALVGLGQAKPRRGRPPKTAA